MEQNVILVTIKPVLDFGEYSDWLPLTSTIWRVSISMIWGYWWISGGNIVVFLETRGKHGQQQWIS